MTINIEEDVKLSFEKEKRLLMSRITLVRKSIHTMITNGLIDNEIANKIFKILSMLEYEVLNLKSKKVLEARLKLAINELEKNNIKFDYIKTAQTNIAHSERNSTIIKLLRDLKKEIDLFDYENRLEEYYKIKKTLDNLNRQDISKTLIELIKKDLPVVDKVKEKLEDVYININKIPLIYTEEEFEQQQNYKTQQKEKQEENQQISQQNQDQHEQQQG